MEQNNYIEMLVINFIVAETKGRFSYINQN